MVGGWSDKTKLILISTLVEVVVEVEVELGKNGNGRFTFVFGWSDFVGIWQNRYQEPLEPYKYHY